MKTNGEWLNYLAHNAPDELAAWFDAEHVETEERALDGDTAAQDGDSREQLEADVRQLAFDYAPSSDSSDEYALRAKVMKLLDRQAAITANETNHDNPYVGLVRGKQWERTEISDYYCGRCGWKVTDHDSYCPECGGALHKASNKLDSKFDARKTAETPETDAAKGDICDFDDSREKLEADVREWIDIATYKKFTPERMLEVMLHWLDRQAAITERKATKRHELFCETCEAESDKRIAELQEQVDELTTERVKLQEQLLIGWECECRLQAERERYRKKFGKCLDYADAIHALMDDEGMA